MATISAENPDHSSAAAASLVDLLREAWNWPERRRNLAGALACLGLLVLMFWETIRHFVQVWSTDENYSHGFLVPLLSLYFANEAAKRSPIEMGNDKGAAIGVVLLVAAILGRLATVVIPVGIIGDLSFVLGLSGICALLLGTASLRRFGFALFFLVFMIPLPVALYAMIASPLQLSASQAASAILNASGIPVLCEGNLMTLPGDVKMFVAEACSGMRQLTGFLALTTAAAYLTNRPAWYRGIIIALALPVAMTANITRVTLTGWIMFYNPRYAVGTFHTVEGLLMMGFGLSMLAAACWFLNLVVPLPEPSARLADVAEEYRGSR